jgi:hypothetical protein
MKTIDDLLEAVKWIPEIKIKPLKMVPEGTDKESLIEALDEYLAELKTTRFDPPERRVVFHTNAKGKELFHKAMKDYAMEEFKAEKE